MKKIIVMLSLLTTMTIASNIKDNESYIEKSKNIQELIILENTKIKEDFISYIDNSINYEDLLEVYKIDKNKRKEIIIKDCNLEKAYNALNTKITFIVNESNFKESKIIFNPYAQSSSNNISFCFINNSDYAKYKIVLKMIATKKAQKRGQYEY